MTDLDGYYRRPVTGTVKEVTSAGDVHVAGVQYGFRRDDWDEKARILVPLPTDLTTLGSYPAPTPLKETHA